MTETPRVSIIIPTRNAAGWLARAIFSIGPMAEAEILVVDDGSTDSTPGLLAQFAEHDPRLRLLVGIGEGASAARNLAIGAARAPLIAFLDADDRWRLGKLEAQLAFHEAHPEMGFSFTDYRHVTATREDRGPCFAYWPRFAASLAGRETPFLVAAAPATLLAENVVGTSTVMVRTDLLRAAGGFDRNMSQSEDWDLWLRLAALAPVGCLPQVLTEYTMHRPGNLSGERSARLDAMRIIARRHGPAAQRLDPSALRSCAARLLVASAEAAAADGARLKAAALHLGAALRQPARRHFREAAAALLR
ncbi:MAG: glycosyltransferase [Roseococcus sp.]|nr:glycosyltransferase [Roseococcus sp.]